MGIINKVLSLLYPPKCVFCGRLLEDNEEEICEHCETNIKTPTGKAIHCDGSFYSDCVAPLYYKGVVRDSILRFKFNGRSSYAKTYARLIAGCVREELNRDYDFITWVPVSKKRLRKRGYDQARLLAEEVGRLLNKEVRPVLIKTVHNKAQSSIGTPEKRRANVLGVYSVTDKEQIKDKKILIIDDIHTTGATLSECAKTMLLAGADEIFCAAIAKTE